MKQVRKTAAGKAISAYIMLRADGTHVATIQVFHGNACQVDVWNHGLDNPTRKRLDDAKDYGPTQRRASGYGYDKFTAALDGIEIDGQRLTNHCGEQLAPPDGAEGWPQNTKAPVGYSLANWSTEKQVWRSCYRLPGLKYLEAIGYQVIQAI